MEVLTPADHLGPIIQLLESRHGVQEHLWTRWDDDDDDDDDVSGEEEEEEEEDENARRPASTATAGAKEKEKEEEELELELELDEEEGSISYLPGGNTVLVRYVLPWQEVLSSLHDEIKSSSAGFASMDYSPCGMQVSVRFLLIFIFLPSFLPSFVRSFLRSLSLSSLSLSCSLYLSLTQCFTLSIYRSTLFARKARSRGWSRQARD